MRFYLDTEFVEDGETIMPISIGIVTDTGKTLYIEMLFDEEKAKAHDFVRENVLPHLTKGPRFSREQAASLIERFVRTCVSDETKDGESPEIEFWAYYADYDWVLLCQIFGTMMDLPEGFPKHCMDLQQMWVTMGSPAAMKPEQPKNAHNALADAQWNRRFDQNIQKTLDTIAKVVGPAFDAATAKKEEEPETCEQCRFFQNWESCRIVAPVIYTLIKPQGRDRDRALNESSSGWPNVDRRDWCGQFQRKEES